VVVVLLGMLSSAVFFRAEAYSNLISTETSDFATDVTEISFDQIPMLDSASANVLTNRKLGELSDLVSQFEVDASSAQINYQNRPVRVTYLNYGDFFKWWANRAEGIPAYMITDMVTQEVTVVRLEEGMHYSPSELFNHNLMRHLRFQYPTLMFSDVNFEIDEEGHPWWIASVVDKTIGLFGGTDVVGAVLLDAVTGESVYCDVADVPTWVDRVYNAELIIEQYDYHGLYIDGFWNSIFGQTGCTATTEGYNYIAQDDDVWLYTGITSVVGDQSNIGFILVNQRTKEAKYYAIAGAEEYSAMNSAQGAVQQYGYQATFPLLLNVSGQPTYFMALKDSSSLVKMYAMVNVQQYQIVATGSSVMACETAYISQLQENNIEVDDSVLVDESLRFEAQGVISDIRSAVLDGTTYYYFRLENDPTYYRISAAACEAAIVANVGDTVTITGSSEATGEIREANTIS
ncbi:MAG: CvpA family protein, partial [Clostridiales bacterium]|nr:CvpA family protein [Clostridiales bacterium]